MSDFDEKYTILEEMFSGIWYYRRKIAKSSTNGLNEEKKLDLFWYSCEIVNLEFCKLIYSNYNKHNIIIDIFKNELHNNYFKTLIEQDNNIEILKWLFLISNFKQEYKFYLIDIFF